MAQSFSPNSPETNTPLGYEVKRTLWLAGPLIVGQLTNFGMNFVDTVMAGRLGTVDLGAIAVGSSIWAAGFLFVLGLLLAVSAAVSRLDGAGERDRVGEFVRQALWLGLVLGVGLWAFARSGEWVMTRMDVTPQVATLAMDYLRAISWGAPALVGMLVLRFFSEGTGKTGPTMYVGMLGIACNIPLNAVLMFGLMGFPKLGAVGAGWATAIVFWLQFLAFLGWVTHRPHYKKYQVWACFSPPDRREISALVKLGLPIGIMVFLEGGMFVGSALLIGTLGALPVAAHQVAMNYAGLVFMVPVGLAGAITVRVGNALGRGEPVAAQRAGRIGIALALTFAMVSAAVIIAIPEAIVALYTSEPDVTELAVSLLFFAALFQIADGLQVAAAGSLRGYKDTRRPMVYSVIAYWAVGMSLGAYLTFSQGLGPKGMWMGIIAGLTVASVLLGGRFIRVSKDTIDQQA